MKPRPTWINMAMMSIQVYFLWREVLHRDSMPPVSDTVHRGWIALYFISFIYFTVSAYTSARHNEKLD